MVSRIAFSTVDGVSVCDHLAHSAAFLVLEIEDGREVSRTLRTREAGPCGNHKSFVEILDGCDAVVCGGIGQGAFNSLIASGIRPVVAAAPGLIDDAAREYLAGSLATTDARVCLCH